MKTQFYYSPSAFLHIGNDLTLSSFSTSLRYHSRSVRRFRSSFGTECETCALIWNLVRNKPRGCHQKHLLWALMFLKTASTNELLASNFDCTEKTLRKWVWFFVKSISMMKRYVVCYNSIPLNYFKI